MRDLAMSKFSRIASALLIAFIMTIPVGMSASARFISPDDWDPTKPGVGTNRYSYSENDPINKSDPNGHVSIGRIPGCAECPSLTLDDVQLGLDVVGMVGPLGMPADATNAAISVVRGNYEDAVLSVLGMFPGPGDALTGAKLANKGIKYGREVTAKGIVNTYSKNRHQALREAKRHLGIPVSAQPDLTIKPGTPLGNKFNLTKDNKVLYEYTNSKGKKVYIREDKAKAYDDGGKGDQGPHFNSGSDPKGLKDHHYFDTPTSEQKSGPGVQ